MSEWTLTVVRDWSQRAENEPVTEMEFLEYDEPDAEGFVGCVQMGVQIRPGFIVWKRFLLRPAQLSFFTSEIAARYHAGGPK